MLKLMAWSLILIKRMGFMPGAARIGDTDTGHGTYTPDTVKAGSSTVFVNGIGAARSGDDHGQHVNTVKPYDVHPAVCGTGSSTVLINGKAAFRIGDPVDSATQAAGSGNVIVGG
jgi:uncharacterized Zn-binding protein involved in type VI secretion